MKYYRLRFDDACRREFDDAHDFRARQAIRADLHARSHFHAATAEPSSR